MRNFMRKALIASTVATAGVAVAATASFGQAAPPVDATVEFTGNLGNVCTFGTPTAGTLDIDPGDDTQLGSQFGAGTQGEVDLDCTGATSVLTLGLPTDAGSAPGPVGNVVNAFASAEVTDSLGLQDVNNTNGTLAPAGGATLTGPFGPATVFVDMTIDSNDPIVGGNYVYNVVLTATPQ